MSGSIRRWTVQLVSAPEHWGRERCRMVVLAVIAVIGAIDYLTGFWVSLQLFYLVPIMLGVVWLNGPDRWLIAALCVVVRLASDVAAGIFEHVDPLSVVWNRLAEFGLFCVVVWAIDALVSLQRQLEERVRQRTLALQQAIAARDELQGQLLEISRRERGAIGHDLHDGLGQHLTATSMAANLLSARLAASQHPAAEDARRVVQMVQEGIAQTRSLARGLLLSSIEPGNLIPELEELASATRARHGVPCEFVFRGSVAGADVTRASHLFYIAQEAARNAARHGRPKRILIELEGTPEWLELSICDDGAGLPADLSGHPGLGLKIMRHRSELIGAAFTVTAIEPSGTCVRCRVPLGVVPRAIAASPASDADPSTANL